jgi:hypothetical protein
MRRNITAATPISASTSYKAITILFLLVFYLVHFARIYLKGAPHKFPMGPYSFVVQAAVVGSTSRD